jgi:plastocyanin
MRVLAVFLLGALLGCSSSVSSGPPDTGSTQPTMDVPASDAPAADLPVVDRVTADLVDAPIPILDVTDVTDVPVDRPAGDLGATDAGCASPLFLCGGECVDLRSSARNCGACGNACPAAGLCLNGSCLACGGCSPGSTCCGSACVDLSTNPNHCGSCGTTCPAGRPCSAGVCIADDCPGGQFCAGTCVRTSTDPSNCGGCGQRCCAGNVCSGGVCTVACAAGMTACPGSMSSCRGGVCADTRTDPTHCGTCATRCAAGETCVDGACQGSGFMALAPCNAVGDYTTGSTIRFGAALGSAYSPACLTVRVGDTVTWEGDFSGHPRSPSTRGTAMNPIPRASTGTSQAVQFTRAGFFPFYCEFHGDDAGGGMAGVVRVIE